MSLCSVGSAYISEFMSMINKSLNKKKRDIIQTSGNAKLNVHISVPRFIIVKQKAFYVKVKGKRCKILLNLGKTDLANSLEIVLLL